MPNTNFFLSNCVGATRPTLHLVDPYFNINITNSLKLSNFDLQAPSLQAVYTQSPNAGLSIREFPVSLCLG